jgi:hypothetical protein
MSTPPPNLPEQDESRFQPPETRPPESQPGQQSQQIIAPPQSDPVATPQGESPAQRLMWGVGGAAGCLLLLLIPIFVSVLAIAGTLSGGLGLLNDAFNVVFNPEPPSASVVSSQTIVTRIQPLGQLVSTQVQMAKADIEVNIQQGAFAMCNHSANHVASATIEAGIDLYQIGPDAITYDETTDTYTVLVPRPVVTSCYVEFIDQYERNRTGPTCTVDWDDARQIAQYEALLSFRDDAVEGGLLATAERDARQALTTFIQGLTGSNVVIEFVDVEGIDPMAACAPEIPADWAINAETGQWIRVN